MIIGSSTNPASYFQGRFKTVRKKEVNYVPREGHAEMLISGGLSGLASGAGAYNGLLAIPSMGPSGVISLGIAAGSVMPAVSSGAVFSDQRKVQYSEVQVPMTPEEEWAAMTPLEQAHFKINEALEKWQNLRQPHKDQMQALKQAIMQIEEDVHRLTHTPSSGNAEEKRLEGIRLKAKQNVLQEHQQLLSAAEKVYEALDKQILEREEKLIQGQEKLNMMQLQQGVIQMHEQLEKVKVAKETDTQDEPMMFEMEKQRVQIESVMASIQQALDVESVLKNMTIADAAKG
jgi:hypothetical protein